MPFSPCGICSGEENGKVTSVDEEMKYDRVKWGVNALAGIFL